MRSLNTHKLVLKKSSKLTKLKIESLVTDYSGEYGSNPRRNKRNFEMSLKFDQIE